MLDYVVFGIFLGKLFSKIQKFFSNLLHGEQNESSQPIFKIIPELQPLLKIAPQLRQLQIDLIKIDMDKDPLNGLIEYFKLVAPFADQNVMKLWEPLEGKGEQYHPICRALRTLTEQLSVSGRNRNSCNRTFPGQEVNSSNVYIGCWFSVYKLEDIMKLSPEDFDYTDNCRRSRETISAFRPPLITAIALLLLEVSLSTPHYDKESNVTLVPAHL